MMMMKGSSSYADEVSSGHLGSQLGILPNQSPLSVVQTLACHPTSLGVDYQRDGMVWPQSSFNDVSMLSFY